MHTLLLCISQCKYDQHDPPFEHAYFRREEFLLKVLITMENVLFNLEMTTGYH